MFANFLDKRSAGRNAKKFFFSPEITADLTSINDVSGSSGDTVNPTVDKGKRVENLITDANPNAMIVDQPNKDDQIDKEIDQQEFSLNVTHFWGTAWAPIEAFSDLKLSSPI